MSIRRIERFFILFILLVLTAPAPLAAQTPEPVADDPLIHMPGTQPEEVTLIAPEYCAPCHGGYSQAVEPVAHWRGSMMAQAGRDFLFWAAFTVAGQDSIWSTGSRNGTDSCVRCHLPKGWLEGRADPPDASAFTGADFDGVQCDLCHRMVDPFFELTYSGERESDDWPGYWDEPDSGDSLLPSLIDAAYMADLYLTLDFGLFNGDPFFVDNLPFSAAYSENSAGQYFVSPDTRKRASFADGGGNHRIIYSRYHKSKYFCGTCHDVSLPQSANAGADATQPLPSEVNAAYTYGHMQRTFSEFMLSAYGEVDGAAGLGPFAPDTFSTSRTSNLIATCQDCHMRDVAGYAADSIYAVNRPNGSELHPNSGLPLHDMTGGNMWVSWVLASTVPGFSNYDAVNEQLLTQGASVLTLDLSQGLGVYPPALLAGVERSLEQLQQAAQIEDVVYDAATGNLTLRVQNQTGHKLLSGFPAGRRIFVNVKAYAAGKLLYEINPYDSATGVIEGVPVPGGTATLPVQQVYVDEVVYEAQSGSTWTGEAMSFHTLLADTRYKDNRIPPIGFRIEEAAERLAEPFWQGRAAPGYFTPEEYAGGYDDIVLALPVGAERIEIALYYQSITSEYVAFLRDEINGVATTLPGAGVNDEPAYRIQSDPDFAGLKAWGETIWQLWTHNKDVPGAAPVLMDDYIVEQPVEAPPDIFLPILHQTSSGG